MCIRDRSFVVQNIIAQNCTITFLHLYDILGTTATKKTVLFDYITIKDGTYDTFNDLITFGPLYTDQDIDIHLSHSTFTNLLFTELVNIVHMKQQTPGPLVIENGVFDNIIGGHILVEPLTVSETSQYSQLLLTNITVHTNDFKASTFIVLREHCKLSMNIGSFYKNSGYFRGTVFSITDSNSEINITNGDFNNNNGLNGGLFYIDGKSPIYVMNSSFFYNFAITAPISYTTNQGSIHFIDGNFTYNHALSVGLFETIDSIVDSSIEHGEFYKNEVVTSSSIIAELDDRTHGINLGFASDSYYSYLTSNKNLLDIVVSSLLRSQVTHALFSVVEATFNILQGGNFYQME